MLSTCMKSCRKISDVFVKFGGHAMPAGATIERARLDELRLRINQGCTLTENDLTQEILIDAGAAVLLPFHGSDICPFVN